jgi:CBS domain-containing protein
MQLENHLILENSIIKEALLKINKIGNPDLLTLFVVDSENKLLGSITDGDIRRGLIKGIDVEDSIKNVYYNNVKYVVDNKSPDYEKMNYLRSKKVKLVPLVNEQNQILKLLDFSIQKAILPIDAVIMAGGLGARLRPLTDVTPKPLLKVGDKEIIAYNFDRLYQFGVTNQYVTVNYLSEQILSFLVLLKKQNTMELQVHFH